MRRLCAAGRSPFAVRGQSAILAVRGYAVRLARALREVEPGAVAKPPRIDAKRESVAKMLEGAGLVLVRHTLLRHTCRSERGGLHVGDLRGAHLTQGLGAARSERMRRVTARFYDQVGGPAAPLAFEPAATLAIAALPGAEIELAVRSSVHVPALGAVASPDKPSR